MNLSICGEEHIHTYIIFITIIIINNNFIIILPDQINLSYFQ